MLPWSVCKLYSFLCHSQRLGYKIIISNVLTLHHLTKCRFSFDLFGVQFSTNASRCIHVSCRRFSAYQWKKIVLNFSLYIYFYITCMLITYFGKMTLILRPPQSTAIIILGRAFIFTYFFSQDFHFGVCETDVSKLKDRCKLHNSLFGFHYTFTTLHMGDHLP